MRLSRHQPLAKEIHNMKKLLTSLKIVFNELLYVKTAVISSLVIAYISYWLFYRTTTIQTFLGNIQNGDFGEYSYVYGVTYIITTILIIILSGLSIATTFWLFRHSKLGIKKAAGSNAGGLVSAAFAMGCPVCGAFLLSALGIAGGLTIFPLQGLELKFLSLGLLFFSLWYGLSQINKKDCEACMDIRLRAQKKEAVKTGGKRFIILPLDKVIITVLTLLFVINQLFISQIAAAMGLAPQGGLASLLGIRQANAYVIIAPKVNPDGRTTSLVEQPTITEVSANPNTGDALADAKVVMIATGKPFYAPDDISFDDPINAQNKWGAYENSIQLTGALQARYDTLINKLMVCSYCCGSPTNVTLNGNCGCAHAKAVRGFYKYMLQTYADKYTNEQLVGESHRWYAIWYPKGMLEDYLLATGKSNALPHQTHGGAGTDGMHGLAAK